MKTHSLLKPSSFHSAIYACASIIFFCFCLLRGLGITWGAFNIANTTLRLEIIASFTGSATHTGNTTLFLNNVYRTTGTNHSISLSSSTDVYYTSSGDIIEGTTGDIYFPTQLLLPIQLTPGEGEKKIFITYSPLTGISEDKLPLPPLVYGVDVTPPALTTSYSGPSPIIYQNDPVSFSRDPTFDAGVGLAYYSIQLSHSPTFTTAIEFITTGTSLVLGGGSITTGERYRRRSASDFLGNSIYSYPMSFSILSSTPSPLGSAGSTSSIGIKNTPTPRSDQCPNGDKSGNYFDGICSLLVHPPILLNVPNEHQASNERPRREKMYNSLTEPKTTLYVFPNYEAPKILTIYENTTSYAVNDIYEYTDTSKKYPRLPYQSSLGVKKTSLNGQEKEFTLKFSGIGTSRATSYLFYRFVQTDNSCSDIGQFCPQDPLCWEIGSSCYFERNVCLDKQTQIDRCIRKK